MKWFYQYRWNTATQTTITIMTTIAEYSCGNCGFQFKNEEDWSGNCDEHSCLHCECDCSDCASEEEMCEYCECDLGQCECVKCVECDLNITELVDDCAEQGEGDWAHPCSCEKKCLFTFAPNRDSETIDFLLTKGWKKCEEFAHQLVRSN